MSIADIRLRTIRALSYVFVAIQCLSGASAATISVSNTLSNLLLNDGKLSLPGVVSGADPGITFENFVLRSSESPDLTPSQVVTLSLITTPAGDEFYYSLHFNRLGNSGGGGLGFFFDYEVTCNDRGDFCLSNAPSGFGGFELRASDFSRAVFGPGFAASIEASLTVSPGNRTDEVELIVGCGSNEICDTKKKSEDTRLFNPVPALDLDVTFTMSGRGTPAFADIEHRFYVFPNTPIPEPPALFLLLFAVGTLAWYRLTRPRSA